MQKAFDVALMPFVMNELTLAANPLKIREYLAAGLPVVSSAISRSGRSSKAFFMWHANHDEFRAIIQQILASGKNRAADGNLAANGSRIVGRQGRGVQQDPKQVLIGPKLRN